MDEPLAVFEQHSPNATMSQPSQSSHFDFQPSCLNSDGALYLDNLSEESSSLPSTSLSNSMSTLGSTGSTENYPQATDDLASVLSTPMDLPLSDRRSCDPCSYRKIRCSGPFPCQKCIADNVNCTILPSRRKNPGTCKGCTIQKIRCVGKGDVCFACKIRKTPHLCIPESRKRNLISAFNDKFSEDPFGKHGGKDDSDNNKGGRKRAANSIHYNEGQR